MSAPHTVLVTGVLAVAGAAAVAATAFLPRPASLRLAVLLPARPRAGGRTTARSTLVTVLTDLAVRALRLARPRRRGQEAAVRRATTVELCEGFAAELAAGRPPDLAMAHAVRVLDDRTAGELAPVTAAASYGGDVAAALDQAARQPGGAGLRLLAACWRVGVDRGGALGAVVDGLATTLRDEQARRDEVRGQLAGPRATAGLLAVLPVLGLGMAAAMGARPLDFLFGTWPGAACLLAAALLDGLGLWWTARLVRAAEGAP